MKKILLTFFSALLFFGSSLIFTTSADAACTYDKPQITNIEPAAQNTTTTQYTILVKMYADCGTQQYRIGGFAPNGGGFNGSATFTPTYTDGQYVQDAKLIFPEVGVWQIVLIPSNQPRLPDNPDLILNIEITTKDTSQRKLACGTVTDTQLHDCSDNQPGPCCDTSVIKCSSAVYGNKWRCGKLLGPGDPCNPETQYNPEFKCPNGYSCQETQIGSKRYVCGGELPKEIEQRCNTQDNLIFSLPLCKGKEEVAEGKYSIDNHLRCGASKLGFVCSDIRARLCIKCPSTGCKSDDTRNDYGDPANVKCEIVPVASPCKDGKCETGLGISFSVDKPQQFINDLFRFVLMIAGVLGLLLFIYAGYIYMISAGDKTKVQTARDTITSVIAGLLFLIFSITILEIIGVDILTIPGFTR